MSTDKGSTTDVMSSSTPNAIAPLLAVRSLYQEYFAAGSYGRSGRVVQAVTGVSFDLFEGETVGIVGETGCGKSTLAKAIMQMPRPKSGEVVLDGVDLVQLRRTELREARRDIQMMFQDPFSSLDPRWAVIDQVAEPLRIHKTAGPGERTRRAEELMALVGLDPKRMGSRRPRELSGGECQRVALARALTLSPKLIVLDEPVSSMDVSVQAQVLNLLERLHNELGLSYLFISHDLSVVKHVSDRIVVMFLGKFCEVAPAKSLYQDPRHPYSAELISSMPNPKEVHVARRRSRELGELPSAINPPSGCRFRTRCPRAAALCADEEPRLREVGAGHMVACHFPLEPGSSSGSPVGVAAPEAVG